MSKEPKDTAQKPTPPAAAPNVTQSEKQAEPSVSNETVADIVRRKIANNPRFNEVKNSNGYMLFGEHVYEQSKASVIQPWATALQPGEVPLGSLSLVDQNWLASAIKCLVQIDDSRKAENVFGSPYCIFEVGLAYFQCLAPSFGTYLRCESVSEKCVPAIAAILTREKRNRLVHELDFTAPGYSKNFSRKIDIKGKDDLAYVARTAFRVLRDVYDVKDFSVAKFKLTLAKPSLPIPQLVSLPIQIPAEPTAETPYAVFVDDNFHYMNEDERYKDGDYATLEEAIRKCRRIVDNFLEREYKPGMRSAELYDQYCSFGEDPFIRRPGCYFSAWDYARQRCDELCRVQSDNN